MPPVRQGPLDDDHLPKKSDHGVKNVRPLLSQKLVQHGVVVGWAALVSHEHSSNCLLQDQGRWRQILKH